MIPVADATGRDLSPSGLAGFFGANRALWSNTPTNPTIIPSILFTIVRVNLFTTKEVAHTL
jgi:hypothetical protein